MWFSFLYKNIPFLWKKAGLVKKIVSVPNIYQVRKYQQVAQFRFTRISKFEFLKSKETQIQSRW